jgi:hypothetical protein
LTDWPEDGQLKDADPNKVPTGPLSQTVFETQSWRHVPFGESTQGESQLPVVARLSELPARTGMEGMFGRVPNADYESPLLLSTRVLATGATGPRPVGFSNTLPMSQDSWTDADLVRLSQNFKPLRRTLIEISETVKHGRGKRTEVKISNQSGFHIRHSVHPDPARQYPPGHGILYIVRLTLREWFLRHLSSWNPRGEMNWLVWTQGESSQSPLVTTRS